jgi:hypothetical protein
MAGGTDRLGLSERKLFQIVREHLPSLNLKTRNIIECKEDILFVWNSKDSCVLTQNVKTSKDAHVDNPTHQVWKENKKYWDESTFLVRYTSDVYAISCYYLVSKKFDVSTYRNANFGPL